MDDTFNGRNILLRNKCMRTFGIAILTIDGSDDKRNAMEKKLFLASELIFATENYQQKSNGLFS